MDSAIDLVTLRVVLTVAECAGYTRAAHKLGVTQPAVSKRVVAVEQSLGIKLFHREGVDFLPTEAGAAFCKRARAILDMMEALQTETTHFAHRPTGSVALGVPATVGQHLLPAVIPAFHEAYPGVFLRIEQGYISDLFDMLTTRQVDVAVLHGEFTAPDVELIPLANLELGVIYPAAWRKMSPAGWPVGAALTLEQIAQLPLIVPSSRQSLRQLVDRTYYHAQQRPNVVMEVNSQILQRSLVEAGMGCIFMTPLVLRDQPDHEAVGFARLSGASMNWPMSMAVRRGGRPTLAAKLLMQMIQAKLPELITAAPARPGRRAHGT